MKRNPAQRLVEADPLLRPFAAQLAHRLERVRAVEDVMVPAGMSLADFASGHEYFGLHSSAEDRQWVFREWAPHAEAVFLVGDFTNWQRDPSFALQPGPRSGVWEARLPAAALQHGDRYQLSMDWPGGSGNRIPAYARRVVQGGAPPVFSAQVWKPPQAYEWRCKTPPARDTLLIYEAHVGMAQEDEKVGCYTEFTERILPRIAAAGYEAIQLMAIQEHPYYASFGYQVSSFFAASSRFGTPEELKALVDAAHGYGLLVIMDLVHSHAVCNPIEGLSEFDGTSTLYFHEGARGTHRAWKSRCFDYGKHEVMHFLLSNCRFWLDEYRVDGFRFDGVSSMLYLDHGLEREFTSYEDYFQEDVDEDALVYLALANRVIHAVRPDAVTIAEDVSGMPALAVPACDGGTGFDYRFAMGVPDHWIRLVKHVRDEDWPLGATWYELNNRRKAEHTISYAESHDQSLVGDQTLIFRLIGPGMYDHMSVGDDNLDVARGISLHKLIRLVTLATADRGYLNFMGNEFGHPDWVDFPREGNDWSFARAKRQWRLADDLDLKYQYLGRWDRDIIGLAKRYRLLGPSEPELLHLDEGSKILVFRRKNLVLAFNFHPTESQFGYRFEIAPGEYRMILDSDAPQYGGGERLRADLTHHTLPTSVGARDRHVLSLYLPCRTAIVLEAITPIPEEGGQFAEGVRRAK